MQPPIWTIGPTPRDCSRRREAQLPRYYFFRINNGQPFRDETGEEFHDDAAAWKTATRLARDVEAVPRAGSVSFLGPVAKTATKAVHVFVAQRLERDKHRIVVDGQP